MTPLPPSLSIAKTPTPLERLPRLSDELGLELWVKRDDLTGSHLSGNKVRKLDFLLAAAKNEGATAVITCGGIQSNHARATALAARPLGLKAHLLLRTPNGLASELPDPPTGNVLLDVLAGATLHTISPADYRASRKERMAELAETLRGAGEVPAIIPEGGSSALGAMGYVQCAREITAQLGAHGLEADVVAAATGSGGTLAGLALGFEDLGAKTQALGLAVCDDRHYFSAIVDRLANDARALGFPALSANRYEVEDRFVGRGYALTTPNELAHLAGVLRDHGLALDPVYTNKALLGLVSSLRETAPSARPRVVVFVHTGGLFGLFGHHFTPLELAALA